MFQLSFSFRALRGKRATTLAPRNAGRKLRSIFGVESLEERLALAVSTLPAGFQESQVVGGLYEPTSMAFAPDGRIFVTEKPYDVRVIKNGQLLPTPFVSLSVERGDERGVENVVFDPNFTSNGFVYVYYTHSDPTTPYDVLSRFKVSATNPDVADPTSETVMLRTINTTVPGFHNGGVMKFAPDGKLFLGVGDGTISSEVQDLSALNGKILRLDVANFPNIIPADNPFVGQSGVRGEIWALGVRNPFSGDIKPGTSTVYINDVGDTHWEEINSLAKGANYGWPNAEGTSSNPAYTNPIYTYSHNGGGAAIAGGSFYTGTQFPSSYAGTYFFSDYVNSWIKNYNPATGQVTSFGTNVFIPVHLEQGPDGSLYWVSLGPGSGTNGAINKISYTTGDRAPTAVATATPTNGLAPLAVNFDGRGSSDPDNDPLVYTWNFGDGATATGATASHTYSTNGNYSATLTVNDRPNNAGLSNSTTIPITVGNRAPTATITLPATTATYKAGDTISYAGTGSDPEDGNLPASAFNWSIVFHHNTHTHPFIDSVPGVKSGSFQISLTGEADPVQWYRITLTVTDSGGLQSSTFVDVNPQTKNFTLATNVSGLSVSLDGQPKPTPTTITGVVNMTRVLLAPQYQTVGTTAYQFASWSDGGAITHNISTPATATTFTANYVLAPLAANYNSTPPTSINTGTTVTYPITVTNTGTQTWLSTGANKVQLAVYFNGTSDAAYAWPSEPYRIPLSADVAPGASLTLNVSVPAPVAAGNYVLRQRMVKEGVAFFDQLQSTQVSLVAVPLAATYSSNPGAAWAPGQTKTYLMTVTNTGSTTWNATGTNPFHLGAYFSGNSDAIYDWTSEPKRFNLPNDVAPGASVTIPVTIAAPTTGATAVLRARMVRENVSWFTSLQSTAVTVGTLALNAAYAGTPPTSWTANAAQTYTLTVTNTGNTTWNNTGTNVVHLGVYFTGNSDAIGDWTTEPVRINLPNNVAPGASVTITVTAAAPSAAGAYTLRQRLVKEGVAWFDSVQDTSVNVGAAFAAATASPASITTSAAKTN